MARVPGAGAAPAAATVNRQCRLHARFPGAAGIGRISIREVVTPASRVAMDNAPAGTLLAHVERHAAGGLSPRQARHRLAPGRKPQRSGRRSGRAGGRHAAHRDHDRHRARCRRQRDILRGSRLRPHASALGRPRARARRRRGAPTSWQNLFAITIGANVSGMATARCAVPGRRWQMPTAISCATVALAGGTDGGVPGETNTRWRSASSAALEDVSIVAAPGSSAPPRRGRRSLAR